MDPKNKWNKKYSERIKEKKVIQPNFRLKQLESYLSKGTALDLACGLGDNSLFLARLGYDVTAIDISNVAIEHLKRTAEQEKLSIDARAVDISDISILKQINKSFDIVIVTYYLNRKLFPIINKLVNNNGFLFMETYYEPEITTNKKVSTRYKLREGELLAEFSDWEVVSFLENADDGYQTIFCKKTI